MKYGARHRGPMADREKARKLIEAGMSNIAIAAALGIAPNTIPAIKRELGFPVESRSHRGVAKISSDEAYRRKLERDRIRSKNRYLRVRDEREATAPVKLPERRGSASFLFGHKASPAANPPPPVVVPRRRVAPPGPTGRAEFRALAGSRLCMWIEGPTVPGSAHLAMTCGEATEPDCPWCSAHRKRAWAGRTAEKEAA